MHKIAIVSDLDDTLYSEFDFRTSGILYVVQHINKITNNRWASCLNCQSLINSSDWVSDLKLSLPMNFKISTDEVLWMYRNHIPHISLRNGVKTLLSYLAIKHIPFCILTDGRSITQRNKIFSLGLQEYWSLISSDYDCVKPHTERFQIVMTEFKAKHYIYIGDNIAKDFITPYRLGWQVVLMRDGMMKSIHKQDPSDFQKAYPRGFMVNTFEELISLTNKFYYD